MSRLNRPRGTEVARTIADARNFVQGEFDGFTIASTPIDQLLAAANFRWPAIRPEAA